MGSIKISSAVLAAAICALITGFCVKYVADSEHQDYIKKQKEALYAPTTKQQCIAGIQLGFDAYMKLQQEQDYKQNNILILGKLRNADTRTIAIAYALLGEITERKDLLDVVSKYTILPKTDERELARKKKESSLEYCNTIS